MYLGVTQAGALKVGTLTITAIYKDGVNIIDVVIEAILTLNGDLTTLADGSRELVNSKGDNVVSTTGRSTKLNGTNHSLPVSSNSIEGNFTLFAIFTADSFSNRPIISGANGYIKLSASTGFAIKIGGTYLNKVISYTMVEGTTYFLKVKRENNLVSIEINNIEVLAPYEHIGTFSANTTIGAWGSQFFEGELSSVYLINKIVDYDVFNNQESFFNSMVNKVNIGDYAQQTSFEAISDITIPIVSYLERFTSPSFGNTITKITDSVNFGSHTHPYSKTQAFNSDNTYYRINDKLVNSSDNTINKTLSWMNDYRWARTNSNILYGIPNQSQARFSKLEVETNTMTTIREFDSGDLLYDDFVIGKYEGSQDFQDEWIMFNAHNKGSNDLTAILYNIKTDEVRTHVFTDIWDKLDYITVSPSGEYIIMNWADGIGTGDSLNSIYQYDMNFNFIRILSTQGQHGDIGFNQSGQECWVQFEFGESDKGVWSYPFDGSPRVQELPDKYGGGHISCQNFQRKGYCYISTNQIDNREVFALKLDGSGTVERLAQTSQLSSSYVSPSSDGKIVLFKTDILSTDDLCSYRVDVNESGTILNDATIFSPLNEAGAVKKDYATNTDNTLANYDASCDIQGLSTGLQKIYFNNDMTKADTMHFSETQAEQIIATIGEI